MTKYRYEDKAFELPLYIHAVLAQAPKPAAIEVKLDSKCLDLNIGGPGSSTKIAAAVVLASVAITAAYAEGKTPAEELKGLMSMAGDIVEENTEKRGQA